MEHHTMSVATSERDYGAEIRRRRDAVGWSRSDLERESGVPKRSIEAYEREGQEPTVSRWEAIDAALSAEEPEGSARQNDILPQEGVEVRHLGPVSAGAGRVFEDVTRVTLSRREFVQRFGSLRPEEVGLFEVDGDSAAPLYYSGEDVGVYVLGDTQDFQSDHVYVFRWGRDIFLKRLRRVEDGVVQAKSLNPAIEDLRFAPHEGDFEILGKVVDNQKQQLYGALVGRFMRDE